MRRSRVLITLLLVCPAIILIAVGMSAQSVALTPAAQLGKAIFFDQDLSQNMNQSCASCHAPEVGWTGPDSSINAHGAVYEGSIPGAFGDRKPPSSAYATLAPIFHMEMDKGDPLFVGGNFWDGRATGERLGNPSAEQALGPFLNPMEQALPEAATVVARVCAAEYGPLFRAVWGTDVCDPANASRAYDDIGYSIAAYEASPESNAFTSKFDYARLGKDRLTPPEQRGYGLFLGKAKCANCHLAKGGMPTFTDYTFDNLGIPRNPENPFYSTHPDHVDRGLGAYLAVRADYAAYANLNMGKHKVPTVRNVGKAPAGVLKAFGHDGYFKSLEGIVHFYNTRDVLPACPADYTEAQALASNCWPAPEVPENINAEELGNLGLSPSEEAALVAFMKALSDGHVPRK